MPPNGHVLTGIPGSLAVSDASQKPAGACFVLSIGPMDLISMSSWPISIGMPGHEDQLDTQTDAGAIRLVDTGASDSASVPGSDLVFDYDAEDRIVGIELLNLSAHLRGQTRDAREPMALKVHQVPDSDYLEIRFAEAGASTDTHGQEVFLGIMLIFDPTEHLVAIELKPASKLISPAALQALT
jgi:uncharacterized protein YuzE